MPLAFTESYVILLGTAILVEGVYSAGLGLAPLYDSIANSSVLKMPREGRAPPRYKHAPAYCTVSDAS